jgi:hypothetical protein
VTLPGGSGLGQVLDFAVVGARAEPHAAVPTIVLRVRITDRSAGDRADPGDPAEPVHALALRCQIRIEPQRRGYDAAEQERLYELFGDPPGWGDALRPFLWTHVSTVVGGFAGTTEIDLPVECSYDLEVAGAKYLHALGDGGEVPLLLLFSGTLFRRGVDGAGFAALPVAWDSAASHRLPIAVWREMIDRYFPGSAWLRLPRATIDALGRFKAERALPTWEQAIEHLLKEAGEEAP